MSDAEDAQGLVEVGRGDKAAFARLFDRHQGSVVRFCARFVGSTARAEELAQDVFIKLYRSASRYRPEAKFTTFLFRIATNHCLNELRRSKRHVDQPQEQPVGEDSHEAFDHEPHGDSPDQHLEAKQLERVVRKAMEAMSDRERAAFCMCRFEGLAYKDIAEALEATEAAVKSLIHRATLQVSQHLDAMQIAEPQRSRS
jgi:RNA polymerase sigma-70 factor (ECF subfamily)